jgi:hypothetical protein
MAQSSRVEEIWQLAIEKYEEETKTLLKFDTQTPYIVDDWIKEQEDTFKSFRKKAERIRNCLSPLLKLVEKFAETAGEAANVVSTATTIKVGSILTNSPEISPWQSNLGGNTAVNYSTAFLPLQTP